MKQICIGTLLLILGVGSCSIIIPAFPVALIGAGLVFFLYGALKKSWLSND